MNAIHTKGMPCQAQNNQVAKLQPSSRSNKYVTAPNYSTTEGQRHDAYNPLAPPPPRRRVRLQGCANTLLNLASDPGRELEIVQCGSVSVLLITALVASDSDETRHSCTKAMTNLLCEKKVTGAEPSNFFFGLHKYDRGRGMIMSCRIRGGREKSCRASIVCTPAV